MNIYIDENLCKGCGLCVHFCPRDVLRISNRHNHKGYIVVEIVDSTQCVGCQLCEICCPDIAIFVVEED